MSAAPLPAGTVHGTIPPDLRRTLAGDDEARATWMDWQRRPCCWEGCAHREKNGT